MSVQWKSAAPGIAACAAAVVIALAPAAMTAQAPPAAAQAPPAAAQAPPAGGGRGGPPPIGPQLVTIFDGDKDGAVTAAEIKSAFDAWYDAADTAKTGSVTQEQLSAAINAA